MEQRLIPTRPSGTGGTLGRAFTIGIWLKAINGTLELVGGLLLLVIPAALIQTLISFLTSHDCGETPKDALFRQLTLTAEHLTGDAKSFAIYYFLGHGIVKVFLSIALLRGKRWSYPVAVAVFLMFIIYELFQWLQAPTVILALAVGVDLAITGLIWHHYRSELKRSEGDGQLRPA